MPREKIAHKLFRIAAVPPFASIIVGIIVWLVLAIYWRDWSMSLLFNVEGISVIAGLILGVSFAVIYFFADRTERLSRFW